MCAALAAAGLPCGVLMGPVVPFLSDSPSHLDATVRQIAEAGAVSVTPIVLHLRPGAREWFLSWLAAEHPSLLPRYQALYGRGAYAPRVYQQHVAEQVRDLARRHGVGRAARAWRVDRPGRDRAPARGPVRPGLAGVQLSLL